MEDHVLKSRGCGMGLRSQHYPVITESWPKVDWFEALSENYMDTGGRPLHILEKVRQHYPVALHGIALSIGSVDPLNFTYLTRLKNLVLRIDPFIVSDHLCWSGTEGEQLHDLLPLPFTEEALNHVVERVGRVQDFLGRRILLENVSTYVTFRHSTMPEWDFLSEVSRRSGCGILLDINNLYVNSVNHGFDPREYLDAVPGGRIGQIHLAGHTDRGDFLFDTHSRPIIGKVWALYEEALRRWGQISTLVEWDEDIPSFEELNAEVERAKAIYFKYNDRRRETGDACLPPPAGRAGAGRGYKDVKFKIPLAEAQSLFKTRIRGSSENQAQIDQMLNPQGHATGNERLDVYADGYPARVRESIVEVYEAVRALLDEDTFESLCRDYAAHHGAEDYNLNHAGKNFPEFLRQSPVSEKFPFLPDLARFEWTLAEVFHVEDDTQSVFSREALEGMPLEDWEKSAFSFRASVRTFESSWPVLDLWKSRKDPKVPAAVNAIQKKQQAVLVSRLGDQVRCELLSRDSYTLIKALLTGKTLGQACESLAETCESEELPIAAWFQGWVRDGLITGCTVSEKSLL